MPVKSPYFANYLLFEFVAKFELITLAVCHSDPSFTMQHRRLPRLQCHHHQASWGPHGYDSDVQNTALHDPVPTFSSLPVAISDGSTNCFCSEELSGNFILVTACEL